MLWHARVQTQCATDDPIRHNGWTEIEGVPNIQSIDPPTGSDARRTVRIRAASKRSSRLKRVIKTYEQE